jgi:3-oxo-5alpha-steroid 4-dehydrogenase
MSPIVERAEAAGVAAVYNVRADRLIVDDDGRVCGVNGNLFGEQVNYKANRAVVLTAGSFVFNEDMVARFAPQMLGRPGSATEAHDGHAIRMAQALGADLGRMDGGEMAGAADPLLLCQSIVVNRTGQRFVTEDTYPGRVVQMIRHKADDQAYLVFDEQTYESTEVLIGPKPVPTWAAQTIEELEGEMGLPQGSLVATVNLYNVHAEKGEDPMFRKNPRWVRPLRGPVGAIDLSGQSSGFTLGGLRTTIDGEVLHVGRHPIRGLFAAGRTASGIPVWGYASGMSLGDGSFFGRRAGRAAASAT